MAADERRSCKEVLESLMRVLNDQAARHAMRRVAHHDCNAHKISSECRFEEVQAGHVTENEKRIEGLLKELFASCLPK